MGWLGGAILLGASVLAFYFALHMVGNCGALVAFFGIDGVLLVVGAALEFPEQHGSSAELGPGDIVGGISGVLFVVGLVGFLHGGCGMLLDARSSLRHTSTVPMLRNSSRWGRQATGG